MKTEFLNLAVHEDSELETILKCPILSREKLHHWPLSYVEKVTLQDGRVLIYKSQCAAASVERAFFERVDAPFLLKPIYKEKVSGCDILIFPFAPYPETERLPADELAEKVRGWNEAFQRFENMPVFFDLSTPKKLSALADEACLALGDEDTEHIARLREWIKTRAHVCYDGQRIGNLHGDLTDSNILSENGEMKYIIDWQRPLRAPLALETAIALRMSGYDAVMYCGDLGRLAILSQFIWFGYAYRHFLPLDGVKETARTLIKEFTASIKEEDGNA